MKDNKTIAEKIAVSYGKSFLKLILVNVLFAIPSAGILAVVYFGGIRNVFLAALGLILLFPFYSGVCQCSKKIFTGKTCKLFKEFSHGIRENILTSLLNGVLLYVFFVILYASFSLYYSAAMQNALFWVCFGASVLLAVLVLFFFMSVSLMTVSFSLTPMQIYKNSLLAVLGEFKRNLGALLSVAVLTIVCGTAMLMINNIFAAVAIILLILPASCAFITFYFLYDSMMVTIGGRKEEKTANTVQNEPVTITFEESDELRKTIASSNVGDDGYIFYNGRMVKKSELEKLCNDAEQNK